MCKLNGLYDEENQKFSRWRRERERAARALNPIGPQEHFAEIYCTLCAALHTSSCDRIVSLPVNWLYVYFNASNECCRSADSELCRIDPLGKRPPWRIPEREDQLPH